MSTLTILIPRLEHPAIEERYASWQSELLLRRPTPDAAVLRYLPGTAAAELAGLVRTPHVLVLTDPLLVPSPGLAERLLGALEGGDANAAVPVANEGAHDLQRTAPVSAYLTLRQFEDSAARVAANGEAPRVTTWDDSDPGLYLTSSAWLRTVQGSIEQALAGARVAIARDAWVHRYSSHRGQLRSDLLELVPADAKHVLEFGCGEAALGAALKQRQECRVVGIELDLEAAAIARTRIDAVHSGDVRDLIDETQERFDCVVGGDVLEHLDEPWSFLERLRRVCQPGALLILSLPNISAWPIVADLLRGRFDYVYMGITCAGHLRFFTRRTIEEMLAISGWTPEEIRAQEPFVTPELDELEKALERGGITWSREDLETPGYYVLARAPRERGY